VDQVSLSRPSSHRSLWPLQGLVAVAGYHERITIRLHFSYAVVMQVLGPLPVLLDREKKNTSTFRAPFGRGDAHTPYGAPDGAPEVFSRRYILSRILLLTILAKP
jgi:hypothetical protein